MPNLIRTSLASSRFGGRGSLQRSVEVNFTYSFCPCFTGAFFRRLKVKPLHGQHASASSGEQTCITAVNTVLWSFLSSVILCPLPRKRHLGAPAQLSRQLFWIQTPEYDRRESCCSAPLVRADIHQCLVYLFFPTCQERSEKEDYTTQPEKNSINSQHWKQYHPYFKQLVPNRGSLTLGCQLFHFSGSFCGKQQRLRCICGIKSLFQKKKKKVEQIQFKWDVF